MTVMSVDYPSPLPGDPKAVVVALETGSAQWGKGELDDAARWIRRAADAAEAAGDDARALALARLAADLKSALDVPPAIMAVRDEAAALASFDDFNDKTIVESISVVRSRHMDAPVGPMEPAPLEEEAWSEPTVSERRVEARPRRALRVAVGTSPRQDGTLAVALLGEHDAVPAGTTEALLVMLDPDAQVVEAARAG